MGFPIGEALRTTLSEGYGAADLRADVLAGVVVGVVALPLSMALSIAVGLPPQHGLYTAVVAGIVAALLGGCKFQVSGPTAAFIVVLAPIFSQHGLTGLLAAGLLAGVMLVVMGLGGLGNLIQFIPYPVTTGFTTGIAIVIATLQLKDVLGLSVARMPDDYVGKLAALWDARFSFHPQELAVAAVTLGLLLGVPRVLKKIPAPLVALSLVSLGAAALHHADPAFSVATIGTRFGGIPSTLPTPALPDFSFDLLRKIFPAAFAIAALGAIESLLSAVIADSLTGTRHEPNSELVALGLANVLCPVFAGIPATGALARTATNIRFGARSPVSAVVHALVVLLSILLLSPLVAFVPMAALAALLLLVAWNMSEVRNFLGVVRIAPRSDVAVLLTCCALTVFLDMMVAVSVGFVLAAVLFMRRMAELTSIRVQLDMTQEEKLADLPPGVALYEVNGPLFFGAAQKAMGAAAGIRTAPFKVVVMPLGKVPTIDATGLVALENAIRSLGRHGKTVVLAGPLPSPDILFDRARLTAHHRNLKIAENLSTALILAEAIATGVHRQGRPPAPKEPQGEALTS
ncbi:MAG: SulP family inorganic anion transporter [Candidatus Eremiobacterota bacterium]